MFVSSATIALQSVYAETKGWSVVPYAGISQLSDQSGIVANAQDITDGSLDVELEGGFVAGLGVRYDYPDTPWSAEIAWEYRSNDSSTTLSDGSTLPGGNYASNVFALNGRYSLAARGDFSPWVGLGVSYFQEVDLDSEDADGERSFSSAGSVGAQVMVGFDYDISRRFYLSTELRYTSLSGLNLDEEGGQGRISNIDYQPLTLGLGLGYRF